MGRDGCDGAPHPVSELTPVSLKAPLMNDPFSRTSQSLTDALLQLDRAISLAESNVAAARQVGLPEAADLEARLPTLTFRARQFLAQVPDMSQPQRWGEARRLLDQARSFQPFFAPYLALGPRVTAQRQAIVDQQQRAKAATEAARSARTEQEALQSADMARRRLSALRQTFADMQLQRGPGFDHREWADAVRSVGSILGAQDVRLASAWSSIRDGRFEEAQVQLDQALGELQAALDMAQRARVAATTRARARLVEVDTSARTAPMGTTVPIALPTVEAAAPAIGGAPSPRTATSLLLIESRTGTLFRSGVQAAIVGRGLDAGQVAPPGYIDLSRACDPGDAENLGVSRRHAEIAPIGGGFAVRDLSSTNGTRLRHPGAASWQVLTPQQWVALREGDTLQFGLLECAVSLS